MWKGVGSVYYYRPHEERKTSHVVGKGANASDTNGRVKGQASDFWIVTPLGDLETQHIKSRIIHTHTHTPFIAQPAAPPSHFPISANRDFILLVAQVKSPGLIRALSFSHSEKPHPETKLSAHPS